MGEANAVKKNNFIQMLMRPQVLVYVILIIMLIIANIVSPGYLKGKHLLSMLRIAAFLGIVCIGQNLVILIGGIDMGVPYVIMIGNVIGAEILKGQDSNIGKALVAVILAGAIIGIIESIGINYFKINAFIMTLGMGIIVEGVAMVTTGGAPKGSSSPMLTKLTSMNTIGGISGIIIIDFINMAQQESRDKLLSVLKEYARLESIQTNVVDITPLGLVEMTRKNNGKTLKELIKTGE